MGLLGFGGGDPGHTAVAARLEALERQAAEELHQLESLRAEVRQRDEDRRLLMEAGRALKPGMGPRQLGQTMLELCLQPLELYTYYLALADYESDRISFPFYFEGGKPRNLSTECLSTFDGLTTKTMAARECRYFATLDDQMRVGVVFTEAERITGLIPQSWYGVPLGLEEGWGEAAFGLVSFQSFQKEAFSESRRKLMDALGGIMAFALKADPGRSLSMTEG